MTTIKNRQEATAWQRKYDQSAPKVGDQVNEARAALPTRLYLINKDRNVVYAVVLGPCVFRPGELQQAIEEYL